MRTAELSLDTIYRLRRRHHTPPAMVLAARPWFLRDPGTASALNTATGYLYLETDRDVDGYTRPIAHSHAPASGIPMLVASYDASSDGPDPERADQIVAAATALRGQWNDGITARRIREIVQGAVGEDVARLLWVELVAPQTIRAEDAQVWPRPSRALDDQLAALDVERAAASAAYRAASDALHEIGARREAVVTRKVNALPDEVILADEDTRRWLCREADRNGQAAKRVRALLRRYGGQFYDNTWDSRDEYAGQWLPVPQLMMLRRADVTETAQAIREIAKLWLLGRDTLPLDVFERTCSQHGSYGGSYDPATDTARLRVIRYGRETELATGPLDEVLTVIAREHYYRDPARENEWGDRIDDDEEDDL